jgi:hypothetical protein
VSINRLKETGRFSDGRGLWLQVSRWGAKSWLFQYAAPDGKVRQMDLGAIHTVGLADARQLAADSRKLVAQGFYPVDMRRERRFALRSVSVKKVTFRQLAEQYVESHKAGWKHGKHALQWCASLKMHAYPVIGDLQVSAIDMRESIGSALTHGKRQKARTF